MFINWNSDFESSQIAWLLLSAFGILATLLPALGVALTGGRWPKERLISPEHVFAGIVFYAGLWIVLFQSLTFGPSVGTTPQADDTGPPQPMESMVLEASEIVDNRYLHGRGGLIGDLSLAGFRRMEAQGNPEQALFSSRRPYHTIPLSVYMVLHLAVYLSAVTAVSFCAMQLSWPTGRVFLLGLLWSGLVYAPSIHWLWGDGWLLFRGAIDGGGACFLLVVSSSMAVVGYQKNPAGSTPTVDTGTANHQPVIFPVSTLLTMIGLAILMTSLTVPSFPLKGLAVCNAVMAAFGGLVVCLVVRAVQRSEQVTVSPVGSSLFGLVSVASGVLLYDTMTAALVGGVGSLIVFSVEKLVLRRRMKESSIVSRGILMSALVGMLIVGLLGTSTNGIHLWNGQQIRSLLHGPTDLLIGQSIASLALIAYPAIITWILKSLCGYWLLPQNEE